MSAHAEKEVIFMALELHRLIEMVKRLDITLTAGENGMHNIVKWVHMVETPEAADFLYGGEIVFTTGVGIQNKHALMKLLRIIKEHGASGIIINTGPFIEKIPQEAIDFGNENAFPIFTTPWKVHLAEIMRIFCYAITRDDQRFFEISSAFKNAILFPDQEELYVVTLSNRNFSSDCPYKVCVIKTFRNPELDSGHLENYLLSLVNYMQHHYSDFALFSYESQIVAVMYNYGPEEQHSFVRSLLKYAGVFQPIKQKLYIGVGKTTRSIRCLYKSYRQAISICKLQHEGKISADSIFYENLGLYKLLIGMDDTSVLDDFYTSLVLPLVSYDEKNDSDLTSFLRCYLENNCSVKNTAEKLFVHRNTVNYKIHRCEEILGLDFSSMEVRVELSLAFLIQDITV